jgi:flotillin
MHLRAEAYRQYSQAAIIDKLLSGLPEVARAMAEPLRQVDKITIVSTGANDGRGFGANQVTADVARMVAQVPELFETLTGVKVSDLLGRLTSLEAGQQTNGAGTNGSAAGLVEVVAPSKTAISEDGPKG